MGVAQYAARNLFDEIWVRRILIEECHVASQCRPGGLETLDLKLQQSGAIDQSGASLETVSAVDRVVGEVSCETQAGKQHRSLRQLRPPYLEGATRHFVRTHNTLKKIWSGNPPVIASAVLRACEQDPIFLQMRSGVRCR